MLFLFLFFCRWVVFFFRGILKDLNGFESGFSGIGMVLIVVSHLSGEGC